MANICSFELKAIGSKKSLEELIQCFQATYDYSLTPTAKAQFETLVPDNLVFYDSQLRRHLNFIENPVNREKVANLLKDPINYINIPQSGHVWRCEDFTVSSFKPVDDEYILEASGLCAWNIDHLFNQEYCQFEPSIVTALSLKDLSRALTDVRFELIGYEPGMELTERLFFDRGSITYETAPYHKEYLDDDDRYVVTTDADWLEIVDGEETYAYFTI